MQPSRVEIVQNTLRSYLESAKPAPREMSHDAPLRAGLGLRVAQALEIFEDQLRSRLLDVAARQLKAKNESFYTISSAGHEQNAIMGTLLRTSDPCLLHYRSGGLMMARSRQDPSIDPIADTLLSTCAAAGDPCSGGRHKVWGSRRLWVPPQTSTIASHLPKAMGLAFALGRRRRLGGGVDLPQDAIVMCSFGDASANHATALSGINAARYSFRRGNPTPILWLCEDNRVGISVEKPRRWIADSFSGLSQMQYFLADGEMEDLWETIETAIHVCRTRRMPVFLRLITVRLWGHAGSDVETTYRELSEIETAEAHDPILQNARHLIAVGAATPQQLLALWDRNQERIDAAAERASRGPHLTSVSEIIAPLAPYDEEAVRRNAQNAPDNGERERVFDGKLPEEATAPTKRSMASHINSALTDEILRRPEIVMFGEDVAKKGGVYGVTTGLQKRFGTARVFDTLLDETTILGVAQGLGHAGYLPIPEIQYLAYIHNAIDQLRGEAASLSFFSQGQFTNPMVVRIASWAYQKGFGGHFHNDNSIGALRDIPGLLLATPARGDDAARMLRGVIATASEHGRVACFLEPIALYHERDLYEDGDRQWLFDYPLPGDALLPGEVGVYEAEHRQIVIFSYANGLRLSLRAARRLAEEGAEIRVVDLRWLNPLPVDAIVEHAIDCDAVLVADEARATGGGVAEAILSHLAESGYPKPMHSVRAVDSFVPLGPAADLVLLSEQQIVDAARRLLKGRHIDVPLRTEKT
jgi:2-oxoisovalerate dehydrogenase E1 component